MAQEPEAERYILPLGLSLIEKYPNKMRVFLILSLLFSAAICASLIHQSNEPSNFKEQASLLLRDNKDVGPEQLNRWLEKVVPFDGIIIIIFIVSLFLRHIF